MMRAMEKFISEEHKLIQMGHAESAGAHLTCKEKEAGAEMKYPKLVAVVTDQDAVRARTITRIVSDSRGKSKWVTFRIVLTFHCQTSKWQGLAKTTR